MKIRFLLLLLFCSVGFMFSQSIRGVVLCKAGEQAVAFANIGIVGKNVGTVSDIDGNFNIRIESGFENDTLLFSCIGYAPVKVKISDLSRANVNRVYMHESMTALKEVLVKPRRFRTEVLGIKSPSNKFAAGFSDNNLGYECGILMKNKKTAFLKSVGFIIADCSYDSIFYRLNVYEINREKQFENILRRSIFLKLSQNDVKDKVVVNVEDHNIVVDGDFLVTLEHVKDLGKGHINFCCTPLRNTHYRKTSQGKWETVPIAVGISVVADVEQ